MQPEDIRSVIRRHKKCNCVWQLAFDSAQATGLRWLSGDAASIIDYFVHIPNRFRFWITSIQLRLLAELVEAWKKQPGFDRLSPRYVQQQRVYPTEEKSAMIKTEV